MDGRCVAVAVGTMDVRTVGLVALLAVAGCGDREAEKIPVQPESYIAFARDFEHFERWTAFDRGRDPVPPSHLGRSIIYVDPMPPAGAHAFPIGTRIVRVDRAGDDPRAWEVHAMVKRGGGYNRDGAKGWEFFELVLDRTHHRPPVILWRGQGPVNGDGYTAPEGGEVLGCNHCHASATYNDSVLSPVLELRAMVTR
ncbi:MAG: hypothetical protein M3Y87_11195 [Myxococcota bacterium]|nr:hypothetical protein [Myxococcota bacterium]